MEHLRISSIHIHMNRIVFRDLPAVANVERQLHLHARDLLLDDELEELPHVVDDASLLSTFLDEGGWIAWGAVPVSGPVGIDADPLWRRLTGVWCDLTRAGCDPLELRKHSLVTPACGLDRHGTSQAELVMDLCASLAGRIHEQALATKLSVGA